MGPSGFSKGVFPDARSNRGCPGLLTLTWREICGLKTFLYSLLFPAPMDRHSTCPAGEAVGKNSCLVNLIESSGPLLTLVYGVPLMSKSLCSLHKQEECLNIKQEKAKIEQQNNQPNKQNNPPPPTKQPSSCHSSPNSPALLAVSFHC